MHKHTNTHKHTQTHTHAHTHTHEHTHIHENMCHQCRDTASGSGKGGGSGPEGTIILYTSIHAHTFIFVGEWVYENVAAGPVLKVMYCP